MSKLLESYIKNKNPEDKKLIEERVREIQLTGQMPELSAILLALAEFRERKKKADGGITDLLKT
jgi:hypothetical protein